MADLPPRNLRVTPLGGERNGFRSRERLTQPGEDRRVGLNPHPVRAACPQRRQAVFVLEASELALDGGAATVDSVFAFALNAVKPACRMSLMPAAPSDHVSRRP